MLDTVLVILYWTAAFCAPMFLFFGLLGWLAMSPAPVPVKIAVVAGLAAVWIAMTMMQARREERARRARIEAKSSA
jgi:hypothetical protein